MTRSLPCATTDHLTILDPRPVVRVAVLAVVLALLASGCGVGGSRDRSAASAVIRPAGCPAAPQASVAQGPHGTAIAEAQPPQRTQTVATHASRTRIDLPEAVRGVRGLLRDIHLVATHTLDASGLRVELYSDGPLALDPQDLEAAFDAPLDARAIEDAELREVLACYRDRIVGSRELEGARVRLLVPSDPTVCLHRLALGRTGERTEPCRSGGVTIPALDVSVGGVLELGGSTLIILAPAPAVRDPARPGRVLTRILVHELVHLYDNAMGLFPRPGELMAYEQRAHYVEAQVMGWYARTGRDVPEPVRYPEP